MLEDSDEIIAEFIVESNEGLAEIESDILAIESCGDHPDMDLVNKVFRAVHTIKGTSGFLGLETIGNLGHALENVLCLMRNEELVLDSHVTDVLLRSADMLKSLIDNTEKSNEVDVSEYVDELSAIANGTGTLSETPIVSDSTSVVEESSNTGSESNLAEQLQFGALKISEEQFSQCFVEEKYLYILEFDLIGENRVQSQNLSVTLQTVSDTSEVYDGQLVMDDIGNLSDPFPTHLQLLLLVSTTLEPDLISRFWGLRPEQIRQISPTTDAKTSSLQIENDHNFTLDSSSNPDIDKEEEMPTQKVETPSAPSEKTDIEVQHPASVAGQPSRVDANIRVSVSALDRLMNLAGELVLGRNQLLQKISERNFRGLESVGAGLDQVTSEIQEAIMQTRMQPIGNVFNKFTRVVRDLSNNMGKNCELIIEGKDVELDKTIIEAIGDPLTHLIRNSVDHGIETPEVRSANVKKQVGTIKLRAYHQEGKVNISIEDDGGGIDKAKLTDKAIATGLITKEQATSMNDREIVLLIFHPGLSTATEVSDVSGRGVGMDVVKTKLEKIGGTIEIDTDLGVGTKIAIKLPLTLAIIPSLIVCCGDDRFAIPQVSISELVRIKATEVANKIEKVKNAEVLRLRGNLLPLVRLSSALDFESKYLEATSADAKTNSRKNIADRRLPTEEGSPSYGEQRSVEDRRSDGSHGALNIIVVESGHLRYGIIVDGLNDSEEIVVKPLGRHMSESSCLAGATVLGDGKVALILDVAGIANHVQLQVVESENSDSNDDSTKVGDDETLSVLVFTNDPNEQFAIPMSTLARIERISMPQIDSVGGYDLIQYRGGSLPLINLEDHFTAKSRPKQEKLYVIVFKIAEQEIGLVAPHLIDIRNISIELDTSTFSERGLMGATIIDGKTTRVIEISELVQIVHPDWFGHGKPCFKEGEQPPRVLLAEDSDYCRGQVTKFIQGEGYDVLAVSDGLAAWNALHRDEEHFDMVVTDLEMPNLDGFELCQKIKSDPRCQHLPVIALTSLDDTASVDRGMECGFDDYQIKLDRDKLLQTLAKHANSLQRNSVLETVEL